MPAFKYFMDVYIDVTCDWLMQLRELLKIHELGCIIEASPVALRDGTRQIMCLYVLLNIDY